MARDDAGKPFKNWEKRQKAEKAAAATLAGLPPKQRKQLFAAFFPKLADTMEAAYHLAGTLPLADRFNDKPYRAPHAPELADPSRFDFIQNIIGTFDGYDPDPAWAAA